MNPAWVVRTARLVMQPPAWDDLPDLMVLKADPRAFALMLGGVRDPLRTQIELAEDQRAWAARGIGLWVVREAGRFHGITGFAERPDGRGLGLRFALWPESRGRGLAREAAGAALQFARGHGVRRVVAVARADNIGSRTVLGAIGMMECDAFRRDGFPMVVYESCF